MKFPLFLLSVIALAAVFPSAVEAQSYPWRAMTDLGDLVENCYLESFEQCKASLGGTHDFCAATLGVPPPSRIPVPASGERHHRGHDHCPDQRGIDQYGDAQSKADHLQHRQLGTHEGAEDHHHD